jgi:hypothetical protein
MLFLQTVNSYFIRANVLVDNKYVAMFFLDFYILMIFDIEFLEGMLSKEGNLIFNLSFNSRELVYTFSNRNQHRPLRVNTLELCIFQKVVN